MRLRPLTSVITLPVVAAAATAVVLLSGGSEPAGAVGPAGHHRDGQPAVTAFQSEGDPLRGIDASAAALDTVGVDGVNLEPSGAAVAAPSAAARAQLARAHHDHLRAEVLVGNFDDGIDDFSEPLAHRLLGSAAHRSAVAAQLAGYVRRQGWDGLNVDLESLSGRDAAGLVDFLRRLRTDLPRGRLLAIDLMAATAHADYRAMGYDVPAIAATVDRTVLMTYDEHGPWEDQPGPVGSLPWTRRCVWALLHAGGRRVEIDLGVAGYGYAWRPHSNDTLTDAQARALAGRHAHWNTDAGEWSATLPDGSTVWWSDARSYRARYAYAASLHLHGVAVWSLGQSDPIRRG